MAYVLLLAHIACVDFAEKNEERDNDDKPMDEEGVSATRPPSTLDDLGRFLFVHMGDEGDYFLRAGLNNISLWMQSPENKNSAMEGYLINQLTDEHIANLDEQVRTIGDNLVGVSVAHQFGYTIPEIIEPEFVVDWTTVTDTYDEYNRTYT